MAIFRDMNHVAYFGAVGDNTSDDTAAIQAAITAAMSNGNPVVLEPGKTYKTTAELLVGAGKVVRIFGGDKFSGGIRCVTVGVRSVLACVNNTLTLRNIGVFAERSARHGVWLVSASSSVLENVWIYQATVDGLHIEGNSDSCIVRDVLIELCGRVWNTASYVGGAPANIKNSFSGTVNITAGNSPVITRNTGTQDFRAFGLRGGDLISINPTGAGYQNSEWYTVQPAPAWAQSTAYAVGAFVQIGSPSFTTGLGTTSLYRCTVAGTSANTGTGPSGTGGSIVDGTATWKFVANTDAAIDFDTIQLVQYPPSASARSGLDMSVHVGNGYHEGPGRADNNNHMLEKCFFRNNAGFGMRVHGLYGPAVTNVQSDANSFPIGVGVAGLSTIGATFRKLYFELNNGADQMFFGRASSITVDQANAVGLPIVSNPSAVDGILINSQGYGSGIKEIGSASIDVPVNVVANDAIIRDRIRSRAYTQQGVSAATFLQLKDGISAPGQATWQASALVEPSGADATATGYSFDTTLAGVGTSTPAPGRALVRFKNSGAEVLSLGYGGDLRVLNSNTSGTPGAATVNKPSGRSAIAVGGSSVVVTNSLVTSATRIFINQTSRNAGCKELTAVAGAGSFTVSGSGAVTSAALAFDWLLVN